MFCSAGDFATCSHLIGSSPTNAKATQMEQASICSCVVLKTAKTLKHLQLVRMKEFCVSSRCRRAAILSYFGEEQPYPCTGCDVCDASSSAGTVPPEIHDFTADFRTVLQLVTTHKKNLTVNQIIAVLRGSKEGQKHYSGEGFGTGSSCSSKWWENVCNIMVSLQLLKMEAKSWAAQGRTMCCTVLCSTPAAAAFVRESQRSSTPLPMALAPLPPSLRTRPVTHTSAGPSSASTATDQFLESISVKDQELHEALIAKRSELANAENCPVTVIAFDSVLRGITLHKPSTLQQVCSSLALFPRLSQPLTLQLASCRLLGNSEHKLQKYGQHWIDIVLQFCGHDSFNPPPRPLPKSMGGILSASCAEFDLPLDKKVERLLFCAETVGSA